MSERETDDTTEEGEGSLPAGPYWEDAVYRYLSRLHRSAVTAGDETEMVRLDGFMQALINRSMAVECYWQLESDAKADRKRQKEVRKRQRKPPKRASAVEQSAPVNVADLKRRIFNPQVSRENVIKALEALPTEERRATIAGLPPGLRRKLGKYLTDGKH